MNSEFLVEAGWTLDVPGEADIDELMGWFPDAAAVKRWSGPRFRYPYTPETFRTDCRIGKIESFCLKSPAGVMAGFGQAYDRYDRAHLARLISHPKMRRQGIGERLIHMITRAVQLRSGYEQSSLFVYRDNEPAYRCYLKMGFVVQDYPDDAPLKGQCYFLTRSNDRVAAP